MEGMRWCGDVAMGKPSRTMRLRLLVLRRRRRREAAEAGTESDAGRRLH